MKDDIRKQCGRFILWAYGLKFKHEGEAGVALCGPEHQRVIFTAATELHKWLAHTSKIEKINKKKRKPVKTT